MTPRDHQHVEFLAQRRSVRWVRVVSAMPRAVLAAVVLAGLVASARFAIDPPHVTADAEVAARGSGADRAAEAYAVLFARRYLTWNAVNPDASTDALEPFVGAGAEAGAGLVLPAAGEQSVEWAEVAQAREPIAGEHVYTVAAQTSPGGLQYLTVPVMRLPDGSLALAGYPAFVGPPASATARLEDHGAAVDDEALEVVVRRALANYLSDAPSELAADLTAGAEVSPPSRPLTIVSLNGLYWASGGGAVTALVQAEEARGVRYTLSYELDVTAVDGRWEVSAIQTAPDA
jgi:hypothetical protein